MSIESSVSMGEVSLPNILDISVSSEEASKSGAGLQKNIVEDEENMTAKVGI